MGFQRVISSLFLAALMQLSVRYAGAQQADFPAMTPDLLRQTLIQYGIPDEPDVLNRVMTNMQQWEAMSLRIEHGEEIEPDGPAMSAAPAGPVVLHLRAPLGPRFPSFEEVKRTILEDVLNLTPENLQAAISKIQDRAVSGVKELHTVRSLPRCAADKTSIVPRAMPLGKYANEILFDSLFVRRDDVPLDPHEVFGKSVHVKLFDEKRPSPGTYAAMAYKVSCLPYRVRVTGVGTYIHEGEHALRNFDAAPNSYGVKILTANFNKRGVK